MNPPQEARPQVWWHWIDGNISREGIKADLEWMHRSGIGGFHQFDAGGAMMQMVQPVQEKVPYMLIIGDKEAETGEVSVRTRTGKTVNLSADDFCAKVRCEILNRKRELTIE